jgi:hypothetical protein
VNPSQPRVQAALTKRGLLMGMVRPERWTLIRSVMGRQRIHQYDTVRTRVELAFSTRIQK